VGAVPPEFDKVAVTSESILASPTPKEVAITIKE